MTDLVDVQPAIQCVGTLLGTANLADPRHLTTLLDTFGIQRISSRLVRPSFDILQEVGRWPSASLDLVER